MSYCAKCGIKVSENAKFCGSCGHEISKNELKNDNSNYKSSPTTSKELRNDNSNRNHGSISKVLFGVIGMVVIVAAIILFKGFDKKSVQTDDEFVENELSFIQADDDDEFNDGLFSFGLKTKSDLIGRVMRHLRNNNLRGELNGAVYVPDGSIDRVGYMSYGESEYDFYLEVYQFENKQAVQTSLNEGSLSNLKAKGEIYTNDCIALFITSDYLNFGTNTEATRKKIIESFKSFKNGVQSNVNDTNDFTYETYKNNRGYQIDYPSYLKISPSVENGDGRSFISTDGETELIVWSSYFFETDDPITESYERDLNEEDLNITYKVKKDTWYSISGFTKAGKIFYKKVFKSEVGAGTVTMYLEYPENEKERYNSILPHIVESFKDI